MIRLYLDTIQMTSVIPSTTDASTIQQTGCFRHVDKFKLIVKQVPPNNQSLLPFFFSPARGDKLNSECISQFGEILSKDSYFFATAVHR